MSRWYRAYEGTVTDAKLGEVALVARCSRSVAIAAWHCLLEDCAAVNDGGRFETTPRRVAVILGEPIQTIEAVFSEMRSLGLIDGSDIFAWKRRQFESDNSTERSRKRREALRSSDATLRDGDATAMQRCATPPETETDTDISSLRSDIGADAPSRASAPPADHRKAKNQDRATRLLPGWKPNAEDMVAATAALGYDRTEIELAKFHDYWRAKPGSGGTKLDWDATWRNWVRRAADEMPKARAGPRTSANPYLAIAADLGAFDLDRSHNPPARDDLHPADARRRQPDPPVSEPAGMDPGYPRSFDLVAVRA